MWKSAIQPSMTVKQLIALLQDFNPECKVLSLTKKPIEFGGWLQKGDEPRIKSAKEIYFFELNLKENE
jgi:hypothetical protein